MMVQAVETHECYTDVCFTHLSKLSLGTMPWSSILYQYDVILRIMGHVYFVVQRDSIVVVVLLV